MLTAAVEMVDRPGGKVMSSKFWAGLFLCASLSVASRPAVAQITFPNKMDFPNFTGIKIGIVVGAVAVGGLVVYLVILKQKPIEGCVESANGISTLNDEKDHLHLRTPSGHSPA